MLSSFYGPGGVEQGIAWYENTSPLCGNGTVNTAAGEECDNGPDVPNDCCSSDCQFENTGNPCGDPATECSGEDTCDGNGICIANDSPSGTACGQGQTECSGQDTCNGNGSCLLNDLPSGTPCGNPPNGVDCFNGDACTGGGVCQPGTFETVCGGGLDGCCPAGCDFTNDDDCPDPVPTVSTWGLLVLALLLGVAAKVSFRCRVAA